MSESPRCVLAGSVSFSRVTLEALFRNGIDVAGVLGLSERKSANVSDYARLDDVAEAHGVEYRDFESINEAGVVEALRRWTPDLFFVVGLSQLVKPEVMSLARLGCVGFHPTALPYGRGRAPVAWLTHDGTPGAASFFLIDDGVDSGPLFIQEPFPVSPDATAQEVLDNVRVAIAGALDCWLPRLKMGQIEPAPQNESEALYFGRRSPEDGLIDWRAPAEEIHRLVRTAGRPYPGAYTYVGDAKIIVWRSEIEGDLRYRGVVGRILAIGADGSPLVQTVRGLLWLREIEIVTAGAAPRIAVGTRLGYAADDEIYALRSRIAELERLLRG